MKITKITISLLLIIISNLALCKVKFVSLNSEYTVNIDGINVNIDKHDENYNKIVKSMLIDTLREWNVITGYLSAPPTKNKMKIGFIACQSSTKTCDFYENNSLYVSGVSADSRRRDPPGLEIKRTGDIYKINDTIDYKKFYQDLPEKYQKIKKPTKIQIVDILNSHAHSEQAFFSDLKRTNIKSNNKIDKKKYNFFVFVINSTNHACEVCTKKIKSIDEYDLFEEKYPWILKKTYSENLNVESGYTVDNHNDARVFNFLDKRSFAPNIHIIYFNSYDDTVLKIFPQNYPFKSNKKDPIFYHFNDPEE